MAWKTDALRKAFERRVKRAVYAVMAVRDTDNGEDVAMVLRDVAREMAQMFGAAAALRAVREAQEATPRARRKTARRG